MLFTCMTICCVHLEVVEATDTDSFINAVRRFVNRRGSPTHMYSDNRTNFRGATTGLKKFILKLGKDAITNFASRNQNLWRSLRIRSSSRLLLRLSRTSSRWGVLTMFRYGRLECDGISLLNLHCLYKV